MIIEDVKLEDSNQILDLYSYYILNTAITFEEEVPSLGEFRQRIQTISSKYPYLVAKEGNQIVGYAYAHQFAERKAYRYCVELSIYIDKNYTHHHIGNLLYEELEKRLKAMNITNCYVCIAYPDVDDEYLNHNSIGFHEHMGYQPIAVFKKCGYKFNRWYNMTYLEKMIGDHTKNQKEVIYR